MSPSGEPNVENLIKLHLPAQQRDSMNNNYSKKFLRNYNKLQAPMNSSKSSTNTSTQNHHKFKSNSITKTSQKQSSASSNNIRNVLRTKSTNKNKITNIKQSKIIQQKGDHGGKLNNMIKPSIKMSGYNRNNLHRIGTTKGRLETNRVRVKMKKMEQEIIPARGKSEEQKFDELIMNEAEPDQNYDPNEGLEEERQKLINFNKRYFKKHSKVPTSTLEFYRYVKLIGKGAFGIATLGIHKLTGKYVAIKTIKKSYIKNEYSKKKVFQEIFILKKIRHSNTIRLFEVFESMKHILIVMEYANGGDMLHFVRNIGKLPEYDTKHIFRQILYGLAHCHCRSVMHRDIKLDNILLDSNSNIKICDFGISKIIGRGVIIKEQCGTPAYMAPEIISEHGYEAFYPDFWSLGVLLFAMLFGTVPFKASNMEELHKLIKSGQFVFPFEISEDAKSLIDGLIKVDPKQRLTIPQILSHPWLKEISDESDTSDNDTDLDQTEHKNDTKDSRTNDNQNQASTTNDDDVDLKEIGGNINYVNVDNLFFEDNYSTKLSYTGK